MIDAKGSIPPGRQTAREFKTRLRPGRKGVSVPVPPLSRVAQAYEHQTNRYDVDDIIEEELRGVDEMLTNQQRENIIERGHLHETQQGVEIPIYRMEDQHIYRTVRYFSKKVREAYNDCMGQGSLLDDVMGGTNQKKMKAEDLKVVISEGYSFIGRFVLEGVRRGHGDEMRRALEPFNAVMDSLDKYNKPSTAALPDAIETKEDDEELGF